MGVVAVVTIAVVMPCVVMPCVVMVGVVVVRMTMACVPVKHADAAVAQSIGHFRRPLRQPHFPMSLKGAAHERIKSVLLAVQDHGQGNVNRR